MLIRAEKEMRAKRFAESWKGEEYERGGAQTFYNDFFPVIPDVLTEPRDLAVARAGS